MKLTNALAQIKGGNAAEKTASAALAATPAVTSAPSSSDAAREVLAAAVKEATASEPATKTAGHTAPVEDLAKLAADVSSAEHEAMQREAQMYGASVADGFVTRLAQYQATTGKLAEQGVVPMPAIPAVKTAAVGGDFEKFASENPAIVREAYDLGYTQTQAQLTKLAEAAYVQGYNTTVEGIYKLACDTFVNGFTDTLKLLEAPQR